MNAQFSLAAPSDEDLVIELMREFYVIEHLEFVENIARIALRQILADPFWGFVFLMHVEEQIAGYLVLSFGFSLEFHGRDALVDELYVREEYRGQGLGTRSLQHVEAVCRKEGIHALHLEVDRGNQRGQEFYRRAGYRDHDRYLLTKWLVP